MLSETQQNSERPLSRHLIPPFVLALLGLASLYLLNADAFAQMVTLPPAGPSVATPATPPESAPKTPTPVIPPAVKTPTAPTITPPVKTPTPPGMTPPVSPGTTPPTKPGTTPPTTPPTAPKPPIPVQPPQTHTVCANNGLTEGLDVSRWQVATDWTEVRNSERQFAFVKALEGINGQDEKFDSDWSAAEKAGLMRSAYDFFHPGEKAEDQAESFIKILDANGVGELPPILDWEITDGVAPAANIAGAQIWLDQVETYLQKEKHLNWTPIIYTFSNYWLALHAPVSFARYPLFIADPNHTCPAVPEPWTNWVFWQIKPGDIPGIANLVDEDYFSGPLSSLQAFANGTAAKTQ